MTPTACGTTGRISVSVPEPISAVPTIGLAAMKGRTPPISYTNPPMTLVLRSMSPDPALFISLDTTIGTEAPGITEVDGKESFRKPVQLILYIRGKLRFRSFRTIPEPAGVAVVGHNGRRLELGADR